MPSLTSTFEIPDRVFELLVVGLGPAGLACTLQALRDGVDVLAIGDEPVGGLVGAATALILAPQSGEETREQIRQRAVEIQGRAEDTLSDARAKAEAVAADVRRRAEDLQVQSKTVLEEGQKQLQKAADATRKAAASAVGKAGETAEAAEAA